MWNKYINKYMANCKYINTKQRRKKERKKEKLEGRKEERTKG